MKRVLNGLFVGFFAGILDVIPMILQKLTIDACLSAFSMWVVIGVFISTSDLKINGVVKGIVIAYMSVIPVSIIIGAKEPFTLIPIFSMTLLLGAFSGFIISKLNKNL